MGNWHCIPSSCAEVVYQEYEPPKIRWRYPGENWQEIEADDYLIETEAKYNTTSNFNYTITAKARCSTSSPPPDVAPNTPRNYIAGQEITVNLVGGWSGAIYDFKKKINQTNANVELTYLERTGGNSTSGFCAKRTIELTPFHNGKRVKAVSGSFSEPVVYGDFYDIFCTPTQILPKNCINAIVNKCIFTITKKGVIVHQETRSVCPEVEKIPCKLSNVNHSIEIKKLPYLEKVEVVPYAYSAYKSPGVPAPIVQADQIPNECLNIYNNAIYVIPPFGQAIYPNATPFDSFITQICSYPGCPPPEYQVICDCNNCQSCPEGTCPIECDDHICCYNDYGVSVQSIPQTDYCGGNS